MAAGAQDLSEFEKDPRLFLFTSLTAGSSHIITATSRMETILKANKIPFQAIDTATDEKARRLWQRRARGKKLPGLVKDGFVIGDLEEIEEWNEFGELKENIGPVPASHTAAAGGVQGINIRPADHGASVNRQKSPDFELKPSESEGPSSLLDKSTMIALPGAAEIAERNKAKLAAATSAATPAATATTASSVLDEPVKVETITSAPAEKEKSINFAQEKLAKEHPAVDHLSAPASAVHSGTATPELKPEPETEIAPATAAVGETGAAAETAAVAATQPGSDAKDGPSEEIKKDEEESALPSAGQGKETEEVTKGVESVEVKDKDESVTQGDGPEIVQQ